MTVRDFSECDADQLIAWVMSQAIRNELEIFHGGGAYDPENPNSGEGFITDKQMRALSIVIRHTVYDALVREDDGDDGDDETFGFGFFQLSTVHDYMEAPGSAELEQAYNEIKQHVTGE